MQHRPRGGQHPGAAAIFPAHQQSRFYLSSTLGATAEGPNEGVIRMNTIPLEFCRTGPGSWRAIDALPPQREGWVDA